MTIRLPLLAYEPLTELGLYAREFVDDLSANHEGYNHTISAVGGFDTASFIIKGPDSYLSDWFDEGLFRRVALFSPEGLPCWNGYVEKLTMPDGQDAKTKSLEQMVNRVIMKYVPIDITVSPPKPRPPTVLTVNDTESQARFGVKCEVVNGGELIDSDAYAWARTILSVKAQPQTGDDINTLSTNAPSLQVECRGFWHTLKWVPYLNALTGQLPAHQVIQEVLSYFNSINPGFISVDFGLMDFNYRPERRGSDDYQLCQKIIEDIINHGGLGGERWVGGIYENRQMIYKPAEDFKRLYTEHVALIRSRKDPEGKVYEEGLDTEVKPWDMRPDRILKTVDL